MVLFVASFVSVSLLFSPSMWLDDIYSALGSPGGHLLVNRMLSCIMSFCNFDYFPFEPRREKTGFMHLRKRRLRSASR